MSKYLCTSNPAGALTGVLLLLAVTANGQTAQSPLQSARAAAERGVAAGQLYMGESYRDGDGVEKDLSKARDFLTKAAAAGSPTAAEELKKLPEK